MGEEAEGEGPQSGEAGGDDGAGWFDGGPDDGAVEGPGEVGVVDFEIFGEADEASDDDAGMGLIGASGEGWKVGVAYQAA